MKKEKQNGIVTLQIKLTRAEHNRASRAKGTEQTWSAYVMAYTEQQEKKNRRK